MKCVKVKSKDTEKSKSDLKNRINYDYKIENNKGFSYIPLKDTETVPKKYKIVDRQFEKIKENSDYKDLIELDKELLPSSYDIIGEIIVIEISEDLIKFEKKIADALLKTHPNIKTILKKSGIHSGEFRTQKLEFLAGLETKETIYKENNIKLKLNVEEVYFSPRLSTERKRIYQQVKPGEEILVMFSGCGPYPIVLSKNTETKSIVAIEKNPVAHKYALENYKLNKITNIDFINADVNDAVPQIENKFDRILMPLPKSAEDFLELALSVSKKGTIIHFYDFEHETEFDKGKEKVKQACKKNGIKYHILDLVKCGQYSPGKYRICIDLEILLKTAEHSQL